MESAAGSHYQTGAWEAFSTEWADDPGRGQSRRRGRRPGRVGDSVGKTYICGKCGASYRQSTSLWRHRQKCEGRFTLLCQFCDCIFHRKDHYRSHLFNKHEYIDPVLGPPGGTLIMLPPQGQAEQQDENPSDSGSHEHAGVESEGQD